MGDSPSSDSGQSDESIEAAERFDDQQTGNFGGGNILASGNVTAYYSDERLKTRTGIIQDAVEKVRSLDGFYYTENSVAKSLGYNNDKVQVGLSAQQVKSIMPEIIAKAPADIGYDEDGNEISKTGENYLTVDYSKLVPLLVEAIKSQQDTIEELTERIDNLER